MKTAFLFFVGIFMFQPLFGRTEAAQKLDELWAKGDSAVYYKFYSKIYSDPALGNYYRMLNPPSVNGRVAPLEDMKKAIKEKYSLLVGRDLRNSDNIKDLVDGWPHCDPDTQVVRQIYLLREICVEVALAALYYKDNASRDELLGYAAGLIKSMADYKPEEIKPEFWERFEERNPVPNTNRHEDGRVGGYVPERDKKRFYLSYFKQNERIRLNTLESNTFRRIFPYIDDALTTVYGNDVRAKIKFLEECGFFKIFPTQYPAYWKCREYAPSSPPPAPTSNALSSPPAAVAESQPAQSGEDELAAVPAFPWKWFALGAGALFVAGMATLVLRSRRRK